MSGSDLLQYEREYYGQGLHLLCGVDEAGRGPLAGPVCAAAVIFPEGLVLEGINDSKKLTEKKREALFELIKEKAAAYHIAWASVEEIETLNILRAAMLAMKRAVEGLSLQPDLVMVDGNRCPELSLPCVSIVKGDALSQSIAAASILAKVSRDRQMLQYAGEYPQYGFEKHKGYGTRLHYDALKKFGPCALHRPSFLVKFLSGAPGKSGKRKQGDRGEKLAREYLSRQGFEITVCNYTFSHEEIDLIAQREGELYFVEVKTRNETSLRRPGEAADAAKWKRIREASRQYLEEHPFGGEIHFGLCEVLLTKGEAPLITFIPDSLSG